MTFARNCENTWLSRMVLAMIKMESIVDPFNTLKIPCYLQIVAVATLLQYMDSDLSFLLVKSTVKLIRNRMYGMQNDIQKQVLTDMVSRDNRYVPYIISIITTNESNRKVFKKLGFIEVMGVSHNIIGLDTSNMPSKYKYDYKSVSFMAMA